MTNFLDQIRINKTGKVVDKQQAEKHAEADDNHQITVDDIELGLNETITAIEKGDLELVPRETVLKLLTEYKLDQEFSFKTTKHGGDHYVQAVRQVLSRARKKALRKKKQLDHFKLLTKSIETKDDHDFVIIIRSKQMSPHEVSVYDDLIDAFERKPKV